MCAYTEAPIIADKVENLLSLREAAGGDLDILIYVDRATDDPQRSLSPIESAFASWSSTTGVARLRG
jgi:hypothetical protein